MPFHDVKFPDPIENGTVYKPKSGARVPVDDLWVPTMGFRLERRRRRIAPGYAYIPQQLWRNMADRSTEWRDFPIFDPATGEYTIVTVE